MHIPGEVLAGGAVVFGDLVVKRGLGGILNRSLDHHPDYDGNEFETHVFRISGPQVSLLNVGGAIARNLIRIPEVYSGKRATRGILGALMKTAGETAYNLAYSSWDRYLEKQIGRQTIILANGKSAGKYLHAAATFAVDNAEWLLPLGVRLIAPYGVEV